MGKPVIRQLTHEEMRAHLPWFRALAALSYGVYRGALGEAEFAKMRERFGSEEFWEHLFEHATAFVCGEGKDCVGMAFLVPSGNPWRFVQEDWAFVRLVGVHPDHQGRGIGSALMQSILDHAQQQGERTLCLHTSDAMPAAWHLYERLGFTIHHEIESRGAARYWVFTRTE